MNILIIGLGFVGLTTSLGFAEKGHTVFGFDVDEKKNTGLMEGKISLSEPGLSEALTRHLGHKFHVLSKLSDAVADIQAIFICVGTPCGDDGSVDLRYIYAALDMLEPILKLYSGVVVIKSTVPPASTKTKIIPYINNKGVKVPVASNPEFLREGYCWDDFMKPDRIVCGVEESVTKTVLKAIYKDFNAPIIFTLLNTAEFIKYLSNNMLANMISFSNEMSMIAHSIGDISIKQAFEILHMDKRWGNASMRQYVYPGCGFGGYCLPKDLQAMIVHAENYGIKPAILEKSQLVNKLMPFFFADKLIDGGKDSVGILGLSFKPESDDVRESPAAAIISALLEKGCKEIFAYDPVAIDEFQRVYNFDIHYCRSVDEICKLTNNIMIVTAWSEFRGIDKTFPNVKFIDGRYIL